MSPASTAGSRRVAAQAHGASVQGGRLSKTRNQIRRGMPRRVADYASRFADINLFISIASFGLGASTLVFLYNMARSWAHGPIAEANPWHALTLEWQVSSPPPVFNFDEIPQVVGGPYEYGVPGARHAIKAPSHAPAHEEVPAH